MEEHLHSHVVLYDGACNLCAAIVKFSIRRDPHGLIRYAAFQSVTGQQWLKTSGFMGSGVIDTVLPDTFVWLEHGRAYVRSTAALRLARHWSGWWPYLYMLRVIPEGLRDPIYRLVARNRNRWFGIRETCMVMVPEFRDRFLP
jgi:predicted DCC family thiol-disulfide oxidoreductase YuxK